MQVLSRQVEIAQVEPKIIKSQAKAEHPHIGRCVFSFNEKFKDADAKYDLAHCASDQQSDNPCELQALVLRSYPDQEQQV